MLTLPSGERLSIPDNMRIILEVDSLDYATPATVSRCGMVWFSEETVTSEMCLHNLMAKLATEDLVGDRGGDQEIPPAQTHFLNVIRPLLISVRTSSLVMDALEFALGETHVMAATRDRTGPGRLLTTRVARPFAHCFSVFNTTTNRIR